ncbi:MAG: SIMPL domain-containing protein [Candidatus Nanoarchaeia archaeon]|nr:SIMPL domain-containing protein [Candidatus Nanoarchaeia archaeon]
MNSQKIWIGIAIAALVIIAILGFQFIDSGNTSTLSAQGASELIEKPDMVRVWVGVSILKPNAQDAQNEANRITNAIIDGLRYKGITEADIQTEDISLYEDKTWTQTGEKSNGWRATQTLKIKTSDFSKIGQIVDIGVTNGANQINNIEFYLSPEKEAEYKTQAIADATKNARDKAEAMATGSGAKILRVKSISESNFNYYPYTYSMNDVAGAAAVKESATVLPRDVNINANVMIVYEIR